MKIAGDTRQVLASSAQTEQNCCVQAAAGALLTGMFHAIKSDSALNPRLLMYVYPAFLLILFNIVYFIIEKEYIHLALFPKLDTAHEEQWKTVLQWHPLPFLILCTRKIVLTP